jgi:hypothetical protein
MTAVSQGREAALRRRTAPTMESFLLPIVLMFVGLWLAVVEW